MPDDKLRKKPKDGMIMFLKNFCQKILFAMFAGIMSIIMTFNGGYVPPSTEAPIDVKYPGDEKAVMALVADPQVSNYMFERYPVFMAACEDLHNADCKIDALIGAGDITENALAVDYQLVYDGLEGLDTRYILASGNHDIRMRFYQQSLKAFSYLANTLNGDEDMNSYHFSERIEGYKVIVLGSDRTELEQAYISDEQLEWLDDEVAGENGKPTFVICHQPLKNTHNEKNAFGSRRTFRMDARIRIKKKPEAQASDFLSQRVFLRLFTWRNASTAREMPMCPAAMPRPTSSAVAPYCNATSASPKKKWLMA
jgi:hypothetical protein